MPMFSSQVAAAEFVVKEAVAKKDGYILLEKHNIWDEDEAVSDDDDELGEDWVTVVDTENHKKFLLGDAGIMAQAIRNSTLLEPEPGKTSVSQRQIYESAHVLAGLPSPFPNKTNTSAEETTLKNKVVTFADGITDDKKFLVPVHYMPASTSTNMRGTMRPDFTGTMPHESLIDPGLLGLADRPTMAAATNTTMNGTVYPQSINDPRLLGRYAPQSTTSPTSTNMSDTVDPKSLINPVFLSLHARRAKAAATNTNTNNNINSTVPGRSMTIPGFKSPRSVIRRMNTPKKESSLTNTAMARIIHPQNIE
ncbi:MAG: hypothetical protein M1823_000527 [Watsoniomyces obsoletus]|nr:MAG: hypothetical protein M1823_000527 [Watsoniomyces obsoletus]